MTNEEMQYIVRLTDDASKTLQTIQGEFKKVSGEASTGSSAVGAFKAKLQDLASWAARGFAAAFGFDVFQEFRRGLDALVDAIPNAIRSGSEYALTLVEIQRQTGMSAESTSTLAGIFSRLGIPIDSLQRILSAVGRNLAENEDAIHAVGVATRDSTGLMLPAETILTNIRHALNALGPSLQSTGAAMRLLGRLGPEALAFFEAPDSQIRQMTADLKQWGLVVDQSVLDKEEQFHLSLTNLSTGLQGLSTTLFAALEPTLQSFVDSFANFVKAHLVDIEAFAVNTVNFVLGVIGGLLGIDFTPIALGAQAAAMKSKDEFAKAFGYTATGAASAASAIDKQTKAIDAQIAAIRARGAARQQANQQAQLELTLQKALLQLADLKANSPFVAGLSNAEQQLALQKHAADLAAAQTAVGDARKNLVDFGLDARDKAEIDALERQKARLQAGTAAAKNAFDLDAAYAKYVADYKAGLNSGTSASSTSMFDKLNAAGQSWRDKGVGFANDLKSAFGGLLDILFGAEQTIRGEGHSETFRSGGVVGGLSQVAGLFGQVGDAAHYLSGQLGPVFKSIGDFLDRIGFTGPNAHGGLTAGSAWTGGLFGDPKPPNPNSLTGWAANLLFPPPPITPRPSPTGAPAPFVIPHGALPPGMASGGVARARPGGTMYNLGEGGQDEGVFTRDQLGLMAEAGFGGGRSESTFAPVFNFNSIWPPSLEQARQIMKFINEQLYFQAGRQPLPLVSG